MATISPVIYSTMIRAGHHVTYFVELRELDGEKAVSLTEFRRNVKGIRDPCTSLTIPVQALGRLRHAFSECERAVARCQKQKEGGAV